MKRAANSLVLRRLVLSVVALCLAALPLGACDAARGALAPVPELSAAIDLDDSPDVVEVHLRAGPAMLEIVPGLQTAGLAYHDLGAAQPSTRMAGPLIEVEVGQTLVVWLENDLSDLSTTLHFHGMRVPDTLDGNPLVSGDVDVGRTRVHRFVVRDAGLYWFHPHLHTDEHVELGLQGIVVVRARDEPQTARERILVLDDLDLDEEGAIRIEADHDDHLLGRHGDTILVNGRPPGRLDAIAGSVERWRIVNTANGRHFALARSDEGVFEVVAWDGPMLEEGYETAQVVLAPGQRVDLLVRIPAGGFALETRALQSGTPEAPWTWEGSLIAQVDARPGEPGPAPRREDFAAPVERLSVEASTPVEQLVLTVDSGDHELERMSINGEVWPFGAPIRARLDEIAVWEIDNTSPLAHPFHVHGTFFQVLSRDGVPEPHLGWRDTVAVGGEQRVRIALRYDAPGRWLYHCQVPEHAHMGMMGDLVVD